jgi:DNA-binding winged helix-turn-helix (wHTH) protein
MHGIIIKSRFYTTLFLSGRFIMAEQNISLIVEKGEPYEIGNTIELQNREILLGRSWNTGQPDISLTSLYVSRKHALISFDNNRYLITDLMSKHGTQVNNCEIVQNQPHILRHGDRINLAKGTAIFVFYNPAESESDETVELCTALPNVPQPSDKGLSFNLERREISIDGIPLILSGKDIDLLTLLYQNLNKAVSINEIKTVVWPERILDSFDTIPDVGSEEITALVYRLRRRLEKYGHCIVSVPRFGYMLDLSKIK